MKSFSTKKVQIVDARACDMNDVALIFQQEMSSGVPSWEKGAPDIDDMDKHRLKIQSKGLPYFVALHENKTVGYCYASNYRSRFGYRFTIESSIYIAENFHRRGLGKLLMTKLMKTCAELGYRQMLAVIGDSKNDRSTNFHLKMGFEKVAEIKSIGRREDSWLNTILMQVSLGNGDQTLP